MGMHACFCFVSLLLLIFISCVSIYPSASASSSLSDNEVLASIEKAVTMPLHHRDSPSSPVRSSLIVTDEELLQNMFARESVRSKIMRRNPNIMASPDRSWRGRLHRSANTARSSKDADLWIGPRHREPSTSPLTLGPTVGEFVTTVSVGTPSHDAHVLLDIINGISWLQCETCINCFRESGAAFDPESSSTYSTVPCLSNLCWGLPNRLRMCDTGVCSYSLGYADGTWTTGGLGFDTFLFSSQLNLTSVPFGCSTNTTTGNGIPTQVFDGVLSLGMGAASITSLFLSRFSYCLPEPFSSNGGYLTLGGTDPPGNTTVSFNFYQNAALPAYYYVPVVGISVANNVTADTAVALERTRDGAGVVLDFSHLISYLVPGAYEALRDVFRSAMGLAGFQFISPTPQGVPSYLETCYSLPLGLSLTTGLPPVQLLLEGAVSMTLPPQNYMVSTGHNTYCFAFASASGPSAPAAFVSVLGSTIQQGFDLTFDLASKSISLTPNAC